jgi:flagellin
MSELKGLSSQDPMKSTQDRASYNNEFKDLQMQLYDISQQTFNGVSLFANHVTENDGSTGTDAAIFNGEGQALDKDHTIEIFTSGQGAAGSKVSIHKSLLLSALTVTRGLDIGQDFADASNDTDKDSMVASTVVTFASESTSDTLDLDKISVGVITKVLENIAYLRAQSGGSQSRLTFNLESIGQQKTNMRAALGRIVDVDIAEESMNLAKYSILNQAAASMLAQANASSDVALLLLR